MSEWQLKRLEEIAEVDRGKFSIRPRNDPRFFGGEMPFVQTGDVTSAGIYLNEFSQTLNSEGVKVSKVFPKNTILVTIAANIGECCLTLFDVACPDSVVGITPKRDKVDPYWLLLSLKTKKDDLESCATQNAQKNINLQVLRPLKFLTPPLNEQRQIAELLSTWDKSIEATERLLENSKKRKKALMQQLLTGKKRLPGFNGEWEETTIGAILSIGSGKDYSHLSPGPIPVYGSGGYMLSVSDWLHDGPSVCIGRKGTIDQPMFVSGRFWTVDTLFFTHSFKRSIPEYVFQLFQSINWLKHNEASGVPSLSKTTISGIKIIMPGMSEQQAIADFLGTEDRLINALFERAKALQSEKKALMQQLLTGKKRVNVEEAA